MAKARKGKRGGERTRRFGMGQLRLGLLGGGRWQVRLGLVFLAVSYIARALKRDEVIVYSERLEDGQRLLITNLPKSRR